MYKLLKDIDNRQFRTVCDRCKTVYSACLNKLYCDCDRQIEVNHDIDYDAWLALFDKGYIITIRKRKVA